ncbi:MAG: heat-inducible transcriptional repressor HrcA [Deltaproteobacteria bacterium]|jgi:heat-inducible transcriptional repressor|nr:heat-inducible transcriptional repressor HrcA [Deltaproteobacteria bacterium]
MVGLDNERQKRIFEAVVLDFIRTGEPVASGALAERYGLDLSPASIRKVLHELEALGLLQQAHSSAGRTPTEEGFKLYAEDILEARSLPQKVREQIRKEIASADFAEGSLWSFCSRMLSNLTSQMGVVMAPELSAMGLRKLHFVRIGPKQVLAVLLSQNGLIHNRLLSTPADFSQEDLNQVNLFLEERTPPFTLGALRDELIAGMGGHRSEFEALYQRTLLLASETYEAESSPDGEREIYMDEEGRVRLLAHPDFKDAEAMRSLYRAFENKRRLVGLLNEITGAGRVRVVISPSGDDPDGLALVASPYFTDGERGGALGILGPRRLNYPEIVPVVGYAARVLSGAFHKLGTKDPEG